MSGDQTMDHANEPTKQQQPDPSMRAHEPEPAHEASGGAAAAILATPPPGEPPAPSSPAASESESIDQADATVQLAQGLRERLRAAGVEPLKAAAYHPDIVALALDRVVARQARSYVSNPTGLFLHILADPELAAALPKPSPQLQLPLAAAAAAENAEQNGPLKTTRWARSRDGGPALEVLEANPVRVQLAGGVAVPAWAWQRWEWFDEKPVDQVEHQVDEELPPAVPVDQKRQVDLARINTSVAIRGIDHFSVAASLKAAGLTLEDLEAYRATLHLQGGTP